VAAILGQGISLGRLGPVPIRLDPSLFIILALIGYTPGVTLNQILVWVVVAAFCILVHELGHAVAFLTFGRKPSVLLYGFGGVTSAEGGMGPWASLTTSLAGPLAGFGFGGLILLAGAYAGTPDDDTLLYDAWSYGLFACFGFGILNLLPVLPLDGGAALAAFLRGVSGPEGEQVARYVSIGVAGTMALVGFRFGQIFLGLFGLMFAAQNYQEVKRHREEPQRDTLRAAYEALFSSQPSSAAEGAREVLAGNASPDLREIAAETLVWAELARGDVVAARAALGQRPERHHTDHRPVSRLPEAAVALAEGAREQATAVLAASLDQGEFAPPNVLFPLLERAGVLPDLWNRLGPEGRTALQRLHAARG
jgi:Zn-dependent protease